MHKILIISDSAEMRAAAEEALRSEGCIASVGSADARETLANGVGFAAILLDSGANNGFRADILKTAADADIPVIITGEGGVSEWEEALQIGAADYVPAASGAKILSHAVRRCLNAPGDPSRDRLTNLPDREAFFARVERLAAAAPAGSYVMACIDVENFKMINDQYGTDMGDAVLIHIALCLKKLCRTTGALACRCMADKFALLYPVNLKDSPELKAAFREMAAPGCLSRGLRLCAGRYTIEKRRFRQMPCSTARPWPGSPSRAATTCAWRTLRRTCCLNWCGSSRW